MVIDYSDQTLKSVQQSGKEVAKMFVVGIHEYEPDLGMINNNVQIPHDEPTEIQSAVDIRICVALVFVPEYKKHLSEIKKLHLKKNTEGRYIRTQEVTEIAITKYLQDSILLGDSCPKSECEMFQKWLLVWPQVVADHNMIAAFEDWNTWDHPNRKRFLSINRCSETTLPMQLDNTQTSKRLQVPRNRIEFLIKTLPFKALVKKLY